MHPGFDPEFDDTAWTDAWSHVPIAEVPPGVYPDGSRVERRLLREAEVFGRLYRLAVPLDCRLLYDPEGCLWMSTTPQERIMMYNNGRRSRGHVLVGGMGLGLYPQYAARGAAGEATRFTVIERSPAVRAMVEPVLSTVIEVPLEIRIGDIETVLASPVTEQYDTVFLDTWDTLDAALLPAINRLRNLALRHLAPRGRVLLWGYRWMVRLFEEACRQLLAVPPAQRRSWLAARTASSARAATLLAPVLEQFEGQRVENVDAALAWCRQFIVRLSDENDI
jgi:spermidine synthase